MMIGGYFILEDGEVEPVDAETWVRWLESDRDFVKRRVDSLVIRDCHVSTVFLGINHNFGNGEPLLFETLVFGGMLDGEMERYATLDEARSGHERMVGRVKAAQGE